MSGAPFRSDRARVELALPGRLFLTALRALRGAGAAVDEACLAAFERAATEPLDDPDQARRAALDWRATRLVDRVFTRPFASRPLATVLPMLVHWYNAHCPLGANAASPVAVALDLLVQQLNRHPDLLDATERSARRAAARMAEALRSEGYCRAHVTSVEAVS